MYSLVSKALYDAKVEWRIMVVEHLEDFVDGIDDEGGW